MKFTCDDVTERLPWLLNGTLGEEERREVQEHLAGCESCRRALEDTRLAWEIFDQHLPTEAIVALAWGEGTDPALEEHLARCPRCTAELELARMSRRLEEDDRIVPMPVRSAPPRESGRGWRNAALAASLAGVVALTGWLQTASRNQTLEEQIAARPTPPAATVPVPTTEPPRPEDPASPSPEDVARAEQLAAQLEQRTREIETLRGQLDEMNGRIEQIASARPAAPQPQVNAWVRDVPGNDVVRGGEAGDPIEVPANASAVLFLTASGGETGQRSLEIVDAAGKVAWSTAGVVRNPDGYYSLTLPPGFLRPGAYTVRVTGGGGAARTYAIAVR